METADKSKISIEKTINASIEKVWNAWTDPSIIVNWFGSDPNGKVSNAILDVRPGGYFEITFNDGDQTEHTCSGFYNTVEEFTKLSFSWMWKSEPGVESFITLWLTDEGNVTEMKFEHTNFGSESKHDYLMGWKGAFLKLEQMLNTN